VIHLKSTDQFIVTGRGTVKYCYVPTHLSLEKGQVLKIDGTVYRLLGIEHPVKPPTLGLLVTPVT
jgi:hypothetical protein